MWLTSSSVGRKFIMALTGACLVLFLTFHCLMNSVAILWPAAYNAICMFLGANWYALVASIGLAALFVIHIIYALVLTVQNRKARGADRYLVSRRPAGVEWASQNMLVLGFVVVAFIALHLINFWYNMQFKEALGLMTEVEGANVPPQAGTLFIHLAFQEIWVAIAYIIAFVALWFHLTHGFWSMFQSIGWDNTTWIPRLKCIGNWWTTIVIALFVVQALTFTVKATHGEYINDKALQEQYDTMWASHLKHTMDQCVNDQAKGEALDGFQKQYYAFLDKFDGTMPNEMAKQQRMMDVISKWNPTIGTQVQLNSLMQQLLMMGGMGQPMQMQEMPEAAPAQEMPAGEQALETTTPQN